MPEAAAQPLRFLRTAEAGRFLGLSGSTLEKHRRFGAGRRYRKLGGRLIYALADLQAWADLGAQMSTIQTPAACGLHALPTRSRRRMPNRGTELWPLGHVRRSPDECFPYFRSRSSALREIPAGETWTYGELASHIGKLAAVRAAGLANGSNPIALVAPVIG